MHRNEPPSPRIDTADFSGQESRQDFTALAELESALDFQFESFLDVIGQQADEAESRREWQQYWAERGTKEPSVTQMTREEFGQYLDNRKGHRPSRRENAHHDFSETASAALDELVNSATGSSLDSSTGVLSEASMIVSTEEVRNEMLQFFDATYLRALTASTEKLIESLAKATAEPEPFEIARTFLGYLISESVFRPDPKLARPFAKAREILRREVAVAFLDCTGEAADEELLRDVEKALLVAYIQERA